MFGLVGQYKPALSRCCVAGHQCARDTGGGRCPCCVCSRGPAITVAPVGLLVLARPTRAASPRHHSHARCVPLSVPVWLSCCCIAMVRRASAGLTMGGDCHLAAASQSVWFLWAGKTAPIWLPASINHCGLKMKARGCDLQGQSCSGRQMSAAAPAQLIWAAALSWADPLCQRVQAWRWPGQLSHPSCTLSHRSIGETGGSSLVSTTRMQMACTPALQLSSGRKSILLLPLCVFWKPFPPLHAAGRSRLLSIASDVLPRSWLTQGTSLGDCSVPRRHIRAGDSVMQLGHPQRRHQHLSTAIF